MVAMRLRMLKQDDFDQINHLIIAVDTYVHRMKSELLEKRSALFGDKQLDSSMRDFEDMVVDDDIYFFEQINPLTHELAIVALYKRIEILTKRAVITSFPSIDPKCFFMFEKVKKALLKHRIDLQAIQNYTALDETRLINNSIKHSGTVSNELAAYPGWVLGSALGNLDSAFSRLSPLCLAYFNNLIDTLIDQHLSSPA
jgi:hypothetical protein